MPLHRANILRILDKASLLFALGGGESMLSDRLEFARKRCRLERLQVECTSTHTIPRSKEGVLSV